MAGYGLPFPLRILAPLDFTDHQRFYFDPFPMLLPAE
jgi:hypothetical protein